VRPAGRQFQSRGSSPGAYRVSPGGAECRAPRSGKRDPGVLHRLSEPAFRPALHPRAPGQPPRRGERCDVVAPGFPGRSDPVVVTHALGSYPVYVEPGGLGRLDELVRRHLPGRRVALVADATVYELYRG